MQAFPDQPLPSAEQVRQAQALMEDVKREPAGAAGYYCQATDLSGQARLLPFRGVSIRGTI